MTDERQAFGLYVHWPFCQAKCPYCDFNSHVTAQIDQSKWADAYESEVRRVREFTGQRRLDSIFFGGGTPSLMDAATVERVISAAQSAWQFSNDIEITLEANPTSSEARKFVDFSSTGVNRVSVGVQALNDSDLKALGRLHTAREALNAFEIATSVFPRASFDLIYARQNQTLADWETELATALDIGADHMSLYQLTIEPGTAFGDRFTRGRLQGLPSEDISADMFELTQQMTESAGLPAYEISNHARGDAASAHNLIYWRSGEWAGVGPGSHGRLVKDGVRFATEAKSAPGAWMADVLDGAVPESVVRLSRAEAEEEQLMFGLRLSEGLQVASSEVMAKANKINNLADKDLLELVANTLKLTPDGRPLLNAVLRELLA